MEATANVESQKEKLHIAIMPKTLASFVAPATVTQQLLPLIIVATKTNLFPILNPSQGEMR